MIKRILFCIAALACLAVDTYAATIGEANALYQQFVQMANSGDKAAMYNTLYKAYQANAEVLKSSQRGTPAFSQSMDNINGMMPYLANGAAYSNSQHLSSNAILFAEAYVDMAMMPEFARYVSTPQFAQLSYFAAANLVNTRRTNEAVPYLQAYLKSGEEKYRRSVVQNLIKACSASKRYADGIAAVDVALANYPTDFDLLSTCINFCIDSEDNMRLRMLVDKAMAMRPNDPTLLNINGKLYEEARDYEKALEIFKQLQKIKPHALDVMKHLALNSYNIGVLNYNKAMGETNKGNAKKLKNAYNEAFKESIGYLTDVVASDPASVKYNQALAAAYSCTGNAEQLAMANNKLSSLGAGRIADDFIPSLISYNNDAPDQAVTPTAAPSYALADYSSTSAAASAAPVSAAASASGEIPTYADWARKFIEERVNEWQQKDPYETISEYQARVTEATRAEKIKEVSSEAERSYIRRYSSEVSLNNLELKPYDAENGVFLVESDLGELIVPVPRSNNEARIFESSWNGMQFKNPKYFIDGDRLALAALTFVTPTGKEYQYDNSAALNYTETQVDVHFNPIEIGKDMLASGGGKSSRGKVTKQNVSLGVSEVDRNIPETKTDNDRTFAVIISNENYANVAPVPMALNDGAVFATYCEKTLGLPAENIRTYPDASFGTMLRAVRDIKEIASAFNGDLNIIFYYAGHGIPNESTKDAFLLPIDADGTQTEGCYPLSRLYRELEQTGARQVCVFLDACFSGAQRDSDGEMLASARGVSIKPKQEAPTGNMIVFSAASGDETAFPYKQEGHGLFTYFLLKKLQESKGNVSLGELGDYLSDKVRRQAVVSNRKPQTPTVTPSPAVADQWRSLKLK